MRSKPNVMCSLYLDNSILIILTIPFTAYTYIQKITLKTNMASTCLSSRIVSFVHIDKVHGNIYLTILKINEM